MRGGEEGDKKAVWRVRRAQFKCTLQGQRPGRRLPEFAVSTGGGGGGGGQKEGAGRCSPLLQHPLSFQQRGGFARIRTTVFSGGRTREISSIFLLGSKPPMGPVN